jgi:enterochelin esterase-like enzyme
MPAPATTVPSVIEGSLVFTLDDAARDLARVSLDCDDAITGRRRFRRTANGWLLSIPRPDLKRLEYRLVVTDRGGDTQVVCDPANPERVRTAFGERSVALMPGYERPRWLQQDVDLGIMTDRTVVPLTIPVTLWSPSGLDPGERARLLVVHDGPEYVDLADLAHYAGSVIASGEVPPFRMVLMHPVERDRWYAANDDYLDAEASVLEWLDAQLPTVGPWVTLGASLGGLTSLLLALRSGERFGGVLTQSGSFFTSDLDPQESTYPYFDRVVEAVREVEQSTTTDRPLQVAITCGRLEENFANNDAMASALADQGHLVTFVPVPDLHNYTAWRDALDPALTDLLRTVWGTPWMEESPEE